MTFIAEMSRYLVVMEMRRNLTLALFYICISLAVYLKNTLYTVCLEIIYLAQPKLCNGRVLLKSSMLIIKLLNLFIACC